MNRSRTLLGGMILLFAVSTSSAQTAYPMLMSLKPTAAQVGKTSEHTLHARYDMSGAYQVLVSGEGVSGEAVLPEAKEGKKVPSLTALKIRFTVAQDALPGVRDFRVATPRGVSTLGQLVIVRDPVTVEKGENNTPEKAQSIAIPATVCGLFEKNEDVDFYRFPAAADQRLSFHVRSMRLQDRIHDLQKHADPIIFLRDSMGAVLAQADNVYAGDPLLSYHFEQAGDYLLEIRDLRYQGNKYWEYAVEISDQPFISTVHPLGVAPGKETNVELISSQLPVGSMSVLGLPSEAREGPRFARLPLDDGLTNPVAVVVSDLAGAIEADGDNNQQTQAQRISLPAGISGRIESAADIDCYTFEAKKDEQFSIEVIARRRQSELDSAIRILDAEGKQLAAGDDMSLYRRNSSDSWIENWSAPADGLFTVELRDLHLRGGPGYVYFLKMTRAEPHFALYLDTDKTQLAPETNGVLFVRVARKNGFEGGVELRVENLPHGVSAACGRIPAGCRDGCLILTAAADAEMSTANITVTGTATHKISEENSLELSSVAVANQETYLPGGGRGHWQVGMHTVSVGAAGDIRGISLSTNDVLLKPGESKRIEITVERAAGFKQNITLDMLFQHLSSVYGNTLPAGVTIDSANSKSLLTGEESQGHITLKAATDAKPTAKRQVALMANISLNFVMKLTYSSATLLVGVAEQ